MHILKKNIDIIFFSISLFILLIGFSLYYVKLADLQNSIIIHFLGGHGANFLGEKYDLHEAAKNWIKKNLVRDGSHDEFIEYSLDEILGDVLLFISKKCTSKNIDFSVVKPKDDISIICNPVQISQTLIILLLLKNI